MPTLEITPGGAYILTVLLEKGRGGEKEWVEGDRQERNERGKSSVLQAYRQTYRQADLQSCIYTRQANIHTVIHTVIHAFIQGRQTYIQSYIQSYMHIYKASKHTYSHT